MTQINKFLIFSFLLFSTVVFSQNSVYFESNNADFEKALDYYKNGNFHKSLGIFTELYTCDENEEILREYYKILYP